MTTYYLHRLDAIETPGRYSGYLADGQPYTVTTDSDHGTARREIVARNRRAAWKVARSFGRAELGVRRTT